jgi:aldehyde dehydrogenase (NAD+)
VAEHTDLVALQRAFFDSGRTRPLAFRRTALHGLARALERREPELLAALRADLGKSAVEAYTSELGLVQAEIRHALKHLSEWSRPQNRRTPVLNLPGRSEVRPEPKGVVLILGPWNYPLSLVLTPLVGALAAGDCVVLKPSELAPRSAQALADLVGEAFAPEHCRTVLGGAETAEALLQEPWDHIFFTGSTRVGKRIMAAAAGRLTPVTLELGGKNPCVVWKDAPLRVAAERIAWGKFLNAGQTCVAPDHVWVHREVARPFLEALAGAVRKFYGPDPRRSPDYGRIVNLRHFDRLAAYLEQGVRVHGGGHEREALYIAPTVLTNPTRDAPVMTEEIFGPILPVLEFTDPDELLAHLRARPKPLAAYVFARSRRVQERLLEGIQAGGMCLNDVACHIFGPDLPFGGVGESGMGAYHGRTSFETFSHLKSVLRRAPWGGGLRNPPFTTPLALVKKVFPWLI